MHLPPSKHCGQAETAALYLLSCGLLPLSLRLDWPRFRAREERGQALPMENPAALQTKAWASVLDDLPWRYTRPNRHLVRLPSRDNPCGRSFFFAPARDVAAGV